MDIHKIALYLAGKLPSYYIKANPSRFIRLVNWKFPTYIEWNQLDFIQKQANQSEDLYFMILDDISKDASESDEINQQLMLLFSELDIPNTVLDIEENHTLWSYSWEKFNAKLHARYWLHPNTDQKGEIFQELCKDILLANNFINVRIAWPGADWWIDITADKEIVVWNNTVKLIRFVGQCKYKSTGKVSLTEVNELITPLTQDTNNMYQGVFFFTNSQYQPRAKNALEELESSRLNVKALYLQGDDILDIINANRNLENQYS